MGSKSRRRKRQYLQQQEPSPSGKSREFLCITCNAIHGEEDGITLDHQRFCNNCITLKREAEECLAELNYQNNMFWSKFRKKILTECPICGETVETIENLGFIDSQKTCRACAMAAIRNRIDQLS